MVCSEVVKSLCKHLGEPYGDGLAIFVNCFYSIVYLFGLEYILVDLTRNTVDLKMTMCQQVSLVKWKIERTPGRKETWKINSMKKSC